MDPETRRRVSSVGGKAAHEKGTAHEFTSDEAREAGRKGARARGVVRAGQQPSGTEPPPVMRSRTRKAACDIEGQRGDVGQAGEDWARRKPRPGDLRVNARRGAK